MLPWSDSQALEGKSKYEMVGYNLSEGLRRISEHTEDLFFSATKNIKNLPEFHKGPTKNELSGGLTKCCEFSLI